MCRAGPLAAEVLAREVRGRVVSVHRRAVNVLLEGGPLVALLPAGAPLHPWAVSAAFEVTGLAVDAPAHAAAGVLHVGPLAIALAGAEVVDLRLRRRPAALSTEVVRRLCRFAAPEPDAFAPALQAALEDFRRGGDAQELVRLVGLGEGLTPSGDDAIVGVLAALDAAREASAFAAPLRAELVRALDEPALRRTTTLAAQLIVAAARGLYAEPVLALLATLADSEAPAGSLDQAAAALLAIGHRSGADTLRGIIAALGRTL